MQKVQKLKISVIGLGYVGLPLMFELSKKFNTVGFDINQNRIIQLKNGHDETGMLVNKSLHRIKKRVTSDEKKYMTLMSTLLLFLHQLQRERHLILNL